MALMADRVRAIKKIWTTDEAEYEGDFVRFQPLWSWPKPVQRPHPPVLVGGNGPGAEDRVLEYGDGWLPQCARLSTVDELKQRVASLRQRASDAGRGHIPITLFGALPQREMLDAFADAGVDRCLFTATNHNADEVMATLDEYAMRLLQ
jgi:alkanesulfonate monooxygenase SsuD/methylene tetrahydromethanopterin reductase-like flavin-dependent oxidoreductase (luciferase family)